MKNVIRFKSADISGGNIGGITGLSWSVGLFDKDSTDILKKENLTTFFNSSLFGGLVLIPVI